MPDVQGRPGANQQVQKEQGKSGRCEPPRPRPLNRVTGLMVFQLFPGQPPQKGPAARAQHTRHNGRQHTSVHISVGRQLPLYQGGVFGTGCAGRWLTSPFEPP